MTITSPFEVSVSKQGVFNGSRWSGRSTLIYLFCSFSHWSNERQSVSQRLVDIVPETAKFLSVKLLVRPERQENWHPPPNSFHRAVFTPRRWKWYKQYSYDYFTPYRVAKCCDHHACISVYLFTRISHESTRANFTQFPVSCGRRGFSSVMYFRFCGWRHIFT